jgi:hypothetical protein
MKMLARILLCTSMVFYLLSGPVMAMLGKEDPNEKPTIPRRSPAVEAVSGEVRAGGAAAAAAAPLALTTMPQAKTTKKESLLEKVLERLNSTLSPSLSPELIHLIHLYYSITTPSFEDILQSIVINYVRREEELPIEEVDGDTSLTTLVDVYDIGGVIVTEGLRWGISPSYMRVVVDEDQQVTMDYEKRITKTDRRYGNVDAMSGTANVFCWELVGVGRRRNDPFVGQVTLGNCHGYVYHRDLDVFALPIPPRPVTLEELLAHEEDMRKLLEVQAQRLGVSSNVTSGDLG